MHATTLHLLCQTIRGFILRASRSFCSSLCRVAPPVSCRYEMFEPLHELWVMYMQDLLDPVNARSGHCDSACAHQHRTCARVCS